MNQENKWSSVPHFGGTKDVFFLSLSELLKLMGLF